MRALKIKAKKMNLQHEVETANANIAALAALNITDSDEIKEQFGSVRAHAKLVSDAISVCRAHTIEISNSANDDEYKTMREIYNGAPFAHNFKM